MSTKLHVAEKILKALANRRRLAILAHIQRNGTSHVGDIAEAIRLSFKSTSKHLAVLFAAGILEREQSGLLADYSLVRPLHSITQKALSQVM